MATAQTVDCTKNSAVLYLAFELSEKTWKLGFTTALARKPRERDMPSRDRVRLEEEIAAAKERFELPADAPVFCCYEAGRDGFWLHRFLLASGWENVIVDPSSIQVDRRQRRRKTDRLDVRKLLKMLIRHHTGEKDVWSIVRAPTVEEEDARQLHRELDTLRAEQTGHINRIKGLLASQGVMMEVTRAFLVRLKHARLWDGTSLPTGLQNRLRREFARMQLLNGQIRALEKERAQLVRAQDNNVAVQQTRKLLELKAIGINSAWLYVHEIFAWRQIKNRRQVGALVGLVGSPYQSGGQDQEQGISKAGNRRVRGMAIEIAWIWLRHQSQSALARWYERRFATGGKRLRRIGIVALARKLLVALWRYLESGMPPEGAELADWKKKIYDNTLSLQS